MHGSKSLENHVCFTYKSLAFSCLQDTHVVHPCYTHFTPMLLTSASYLSCTVFIRHSNFKIIKHHLMKCLYNFIS